jgi:hypothetical protein
MTFTFGNAQASGSPHSFKPRSFHLGRDASQSSVQPTNGLARRMKKSLANIRLNADGVLSTPYSFVLSMAILCSLVFIAAISCSWRGAQQDRQPFKKALDDAAIASPGVSAVYDLQQNRLICLAQR